MLNSLPRCLLLYLTLFNYILRIYLLTYVFSTFLTSQDYFSYENSKTNLISKSAQLSSVEVRGSSLVNSDKSDSVRVNSDQYSRNEKSNSLLATFGSDDDSQEVNRYRDKNGDRERGKELEGRGRESGLKDPIASLKLHAQTPRTNPGVNTPVMTNSFIPTMDVSTNQGNNQTFVSIGLTNSERTTQSQIKARKRIQLQHTNRQNNEDRPRKVLNYAIKGRGNEDEDEDENE